MESQVTPEPLAAVEPVPGKQPGGNCGKGSDRRRDQIVVSGGREIPVTPPERQQVEGKAGQEQGNWKMDQDHVLRVLRQQRGLQVKRVHGNLRLQDYCTTTLP